jgi:hypothetical protein
MRALLLAALGAGQVVGYLGGALRLGAISELGARYATAAPDQQAALGQIYLTLAQVTFTHYGAGQWLYGLGYVVIASLAFSQTGVLRWIAARFALAGLCSVANQLAFVVVGALLPGPLFLVFMLGQDLVALAMAIAFWRGRPRPRRGSLQPRRAEPSSMSGARAVAAQVAAGASRGCHCLRHRRATQSPRKVAR